MGGSPRPGDVLLGKYRVITLISQGGMGVVVKARHLELDEDVAIKCLLPELMERDDIVKRFLREARAAIKLKGKHVARVHDVGRLDDGVPAIVMEFLNGADLSAIVKTHGAQEPSVAVDLMLQACEALAEAHSLGIIHRDIKASNCFVTQPVNEGPVLKVLDFGIATAPEGTSDLTSTQSVIGTPAYMAPEQMRSSKDSDARSDIWSLGVVLYELLEGARPFRSDVYSELVLMVGMDPPTPIANRAVPDGLAAIVMRCLEKQLDRRYQSVSELAFDLVHYASDTVVARVAAERCARLLGRRAHEPVDDSVPVLRAVGIDESGPRVRSSERLAVPLTPGELPGQLGMLLGRETPLPSTQPKTPTSIQGSNGQVSLPPLPPRRRGLLIALTSVTVVAAGIAIVFATSSSSSTSSSSGDPGTTRPAGAPSPALDPTPDPTPPPSEPEATATEIEIVVPVPVADPTADPTATADPTPAVKPAAKPKRPRPRRPPIKRPTPSGGDDMFEQRE